MPRVLVVGDVINDILAVVRGPLRHGADNPATIRTRAGGSAANQAAWLASLGVDVAFAGRAGAADAAFHRRELARFGVEPHVAADESASTGSIVVLTGPGGERTMITSRGANLNLCHADVTDALLDGADLLHLTGYTLFEPGTRAVARELGADGAVIAAAGETETIRTPAVPAPVRDTTGAGDAFCAGFLAAWLAGAGLKAAAAAGATAASTAVSVLGGRPAPPLPGISDASVTLR